MVATTTNNSKHLTIFAWSLSGIVSILALLAWSQSINIGSAKITNYQLFPLFGLLAFSLMWSHYIVAGVRKYFKLDRQSVHLYFEITSILVLFFILMHPGLLAWQLWSSGLGLPPTSYMSYVPESMRISIIVGMVSWTAFIAYEFRRFFMKKSWWKLVEYASDVAMFLIFLHALRLGGQLQHGWFRGLWLFYGLTLFISVIFIRFVDRKPNQA